MLAGGGGGDEAYDTVLLRLREDGGSMVLGVGGDAAYCAGGECGADGTVTGASVGWDDGNACWYWWGGSETGGKPWF